MRLTGEQAKAAGRLFHRLLDSHLWLHKTCACDGQGPEWRALLVKAHPARLAVLHQEDPGTAKTLAAPGSCEAETHHRI